VTESQVITGPRQKYITKVPGDGKMYPYSFFWQQLQALPSH